MQIKFKENFYTLTENGVKNTNAPDGSNVLTVELTDISDLATLTADATGAEDIQVLNGDSIYQEYLDYIALRSVSMDAETGIITVVVRQESLVKQVETLRERNKTLKAQVTQQADVIADQVDTIAVQAARIEELETEITEIQECLVEEDGEV